MTLRPKDKFLPTITWSYELSGEKYLGLWDCWKPPFCHSCVWCFAEHLLPLCVLSLPCGTQREKNLLFCYTCPPLTRGEKTPSFPLSGQDLSCRMQALWIFFLCLLFLMVCYSDFSKNAGSNQPGIPKYSAFLINQAIINLIESLWSFPATTCTPYAKRSVMWNGSAGSKVSFLINNNSPWADI